MIFSLSIFLGILSIANKILLFLDKKSGWLSGIAIGLISGFYFWNIGLEILAIAELGFFLVMLFGYIQHTNPSLQTKFWVNIALSGISLSFCYFLFVGLLTIIETVSALSFIWGGYQLAINWKFSGWLILLLAHIATAISSFYAGQSIFAGMQIVSGFICVYAAIATLLKHPQ